MTDSTELATASDNAPAPSASTAVAPILNTIASALESGRVNSADMRAILDMQYQAEDREAKREWIAAFHAMQAELPAINKNGQIIIPPKDGRPARVQSKFASWDHIHSIITPILRRHGFTLRFEVGSDQAFTTVAAVLSHVGGHVETSGSMKLPATSKSAMSDQQKVGSAVSHGYRYTTISLLNIVTVEDDDATAGYTPPSPGPEIDMTELLETAAKAASCGLRAYERWFKNDIERPAKLALINSGDHDRFKEIAVEADKEREE